MRFETTKRHEAKLEWRRWFAWYPAFLDDTGQTAWLETVWRRHIERRGFGERWLEAEYRARPQAKTLGG